MGAILSELASKGPPVPRERFRADPAWSDTDETAVSVHLTAFTTPRRRTFFTEIPATEPGHDRIVTCTEARFRRVWRPAAAQGNSYGNPKETGENLTGISDALSGLQPTKEVGWDALASAWGSRAAISHGTRFPTDWGRARVRLLDGLRLAKARTG